MTRVMYDGIAADASAIRAMWKPGDLVSYYINGRYAWTEAEKALFPASALVSITVTAAANEGDILDVENGDAVPSQCQAWITMRKEAGLERPTTYGSLSIVPDIRAGTGIWILGTDYDLWVADWDGSVAPDYPGEAAKQYRNTPTEDTSVVFDDLWPHRTPIVPRTGTQPGWKWCENHGGLFWPGARTVCPATGFGPCAAKPGAYTYVLPWTVP